jgi:hypothetical protein
MVCGCCTRQDDFMANRWSLWSTDSVLSIASHRSVLSIGSVGSVASIGSVGSIGSIGSIGSAAATGSALSAQSRWSVLAFRSYATQMTVRGAGRIPVGPTVFVVLGLGGLAGYLREHRRASSSSHLRL